MDEFLARFTLFGLPAILIVVALVQVAKALGLPTKLIPWASLISGLLVAAGMLAIQINPAVEPFIMYALAGIMLGLGAMGGYSGVKTLAGFRTVPPGSKVKEPTGEAYTTPTSGGTAGGDSGGGGGGGGADSGDGGEGGSR